MVPYLYCFTLMNNTLTYIHAELKDSTFQVHSTLSVHLQHAHMCASPGRLSNDLQSSTNYSNCHELLLVWRLFLQLPEHEHKMFLTKSKFTHSSSVEF